MSGSKLSADRFAGVRASDAGVRASDDCALSLPPNVSEVKQKAKDDELALLRDQVRQLQKAIEKTAASSSRTSGDSSGGSGAVSQARIVVDSTSRVGTNRSIPEILVPLKLMLTESQINNILKKKVADKYNVPFDVYVAVLSMVAVIHNGNHVAKEVCKPLTDMCNRMKNYLTHSDLRDPTVFDTLLSTADECVFNDLTGQDALKMLLRDLLETDKVDTKVALHSALTSIINASLNRK